MANLYLAAGDKLSGLTFGGGVFGGSGSESVSYTTGVTGINVDQNVEQVNLAGASSSYTFQQQGNNLVVFSGTTEVARIAVQTGAVDTEGNGTRVAFANGVVEAKFVAGSPPTITLGGATVPAAAAGSVIPVVIDASGGTAVQVLALTSNQDTLVGTANNDTFNANVVVSGLNGGELTDTLQNIDSLDGGEGVDTLNVTLNEGASVTPSLTSIENVSLRVTKAGGAIDFSSSKGAVTSITVENSVAATGNVASVGAATLAVKNQNSNVSFTGSTATALGLTLDTVGTGGAAGTHIVVDLGAAAAAAATTLNLTANNANADITATNAGAVSTVNIVATGKNEIDLVDAANDVKTLTITGAGSVDFTANTGSKLVALKSLTVGDGGVTVDTTAGVLATVATGAGADTITAVGAALTSVSTGAGNDTLTTVTSGLGAAAAIDLGAGNDTLTLNAASAKGATVTGGDGVDTLVVADGDFIDGNVTYTSFEVADITGAAAGTLNLDNLKSATTVASRGAFAATDITNAAAGVGISLTSVASTNTTTGAALTYALKDATGTSDSLSVSLNSLDSNKNATADGKLTVTSLTADGIETFNISSNASTTETTKVAGDYVNTISLLDGDAVKTINLTGAADITITDLAAAALTKVDASALTGQLNITLDASANAGAIAVLGGSAADTISLAANLGVNNIVVGNGGGDSITLEAGGGTKETVRYAADGDSVLTLTDTTTPAVTPVVFDVASGYDTITNFTTAEDKIELSAALGLGTGDARSAITGKGVIGDGAIADNAELAATLGALIGTGADFFNDGTTDRAVAQAILNDATDASILFIDTNADGNFTIGTDNMIYLAGVTTGVVISDIVFG